MPKKHPNILLIMTDNQPADLLGCYGNHEIHTPHLDRLAQQGIRFNQTYCVNAMCSPCRASVLTGLMPSQHGIHTWLDDRNMAEWPPNWNALAAFETLPERLRSNGYKTALIGKYHLGMPFTSQNGFDHWVTFPHGHTRDFWNNRVIENDQQSTYPGHIVDYFTQQAVSYINGHEADDDPFFLFLPYNAPYGHWPSVKGPAKNRFAHLYENCPMHSIPREGLNRAVIERYIMRQGLSGGGLDYSAVLQIPNDLTTLRNYFSQMTLVDDGVGQVLAALQQQGLDDSTLVIFTCDHGFSLGHHGFWGHGQATWPANTHREAFNIPLLIRHTNHITPLQVSDQMVSQIDLFSTILDYAGVDSDDGLNTPATNLTPLLRGEKFTGPDAVFMEQEETRAIRTREWLLMKRFDGSQTYTFQDELYDLVNDPAEQHNLAADPEFTHIVETLSQRIDTFFANYNEPAYDLWQGGVAKSNSDKPFLWQEVWGEDWQELFS
ncbi:MAG: sulfatase-like hydrolase/transferase [Chloroflexota bacterium]